MGLIYVELPDTVKCAVTIRARMRPDRAAPHPKMVRAGREMLSEGTNTAGDGTGLVTVEDSEAKKAAEP